MELKILVPNDIFNKEAYALFGTEAMQVLKTTVAEYMELDVDDTKTIAKLRKNIQELSADKFPDSAVETEEIKQVWFFFENCQSKYSGFRSSPYPILEQPLRFGMCESAEKLISSLRCARYASEINFSPLSHIRKTLRLF